MQKPILQIREHFTIVLLICVLQLLSSLTAQTPRPPTGDNPYDLHLAKTRTEFASADPARQAVLVAEACRLREYVSRAASVREWLELVSSDPSLHALVRDEALNKLAEIQTSEGDFSKAERTLATLGFVREWSLAGPFSKEQVAATALREYRPGDTFTDARGRSRGWRLVRSLGPRRGLKLSDFFPVGDRSVAYAATSLSSATDRGVVLRFSSERPVSVFVNGEKVFSTDQESRFAFDQWAVPVHLRSGWNSLLMKFDLAGDAQFRFALRVTDVHGGGLPHVSNATTQVSVLAGPSPALRFDFDDLVDMAESRLADDPKAADRLATLGQIEREHARGTDLEHLQEAARLQPTAERWVDVVRSCREASCRFNAYSAALRADSANVDAHIGLADYYLSRDQIERARDLLQEALVLNPEHYLVRDRLTDIYLSAGLTAMVVNETAALVRDYPGPLWLQHSAGNRYVDLGLIDQAIPLLQRALSRNFNDTADRELLAQIYRRRLDANALADLLRQALTLDPNNASARTQLAQTLFGTGDRANAIAGMRGAIELNPDDPELTEKLADLLANDGQESAAQQQLAAALQLNPSLERVRRRLQGTSASATHYEDERYLEDPARSAAAANCPSVQAGTNVTGVSDVRIERVYNNGLSSIRSQQLFCMVSEQGARDFATRVVQYSPATQELRILHARVYKADGRVLDASEAGEAGVADTNVAMYYDVRSRAVRFPDVQKGDVVELDYSIVPTASSNPYGDYFASLVPFRSMMPQALQRYVLVAPSKRSLHIVEHGMRRAALRETNSDDRIYRWEEHNTAPLPNEPRAPAVTESAPYVHVSTFASWDEIGQWYAELIRPQFALDKDLRDIVARITAGKASEIEKINAIHQFVLRNTHYVALEFGIYSYKPYPVTQVYARRFGDCKDKASLMVALLRQAGIDANIALVRTRRLGAVDDHAVSIALFNHAIVYVPNWDLWLDGTAEYAGSRELPLDDQGAMALVVALDGSASLHKIPVTKPEDNYTNRVVRAKVQPDGVIEFNGTAYTRGEDAPGLRRDYEIAERQRDLFRNSLAEVFPTVRLDDVQVDGATDLERDVHVQFRGALDTFSGRRSMTLNTSWMPRSYVQSLAQLESRTQDLVLAAPWTTEEQLRFQLPGGATVVSVPPDKSINTPFGSARIQYQRHGRELVISTSVQFRRLRISASEYGSFREFCRDIEKAFRAEVKVTLPNS